VKRKPVKPLLRAAAGAVQRLHLRSYEVYQPVLTSGGYTAGVRDCEVRWDAIEPVLRTAGARSLVDLGCSEGYYVIRAARAGLPFSVGVDFDQRRMFTCTSQVVLNDLPHAGFLMSPVDEELLEALPKFDAVIFLSVLHHMMYQEGVDYARRILRLVAAKTGKVCLFEMGQSDEHKESWASKMPDMGGDPHEWVRRFVLENGFSRADKISQARSFAGETQRALFAAYP
jgi:cyclopropane fatty-acyl-phospholipid synthase-like methyltransferase